MASSGSPGGPRPPTTPPGADLYLGIDIGATKIATALLDGAGRIVATRRSPVPPHPLPTTVVEGIARNAVAELGVDRAQIRSIGVGIAAQVRPDTGEVHFAPNLEWRNVPLREMLEAALDRPTFVTNDVRAATFGEWKHGAGVGATELACVWVGTGAGGSVVSAGRLLHGATNTSGEVGHLTIVSGGRRCRCRGTGCLEAYVGGWAIAERVREAVDRGPEAGRVLLRLAGGRSEGLTARHLADAFHAGDPLSRDLVSQTAECLSAGLTSVVNAFNPGVLLVGGGVIDGIPEILELAIPQVRSNALEAAVEGLAIGRTKLGSDAGAVGGAALAKERFGPSVT